MQKQSPVSGRETDVKRAMDNVLDAEQAVREAIREGERRGAAMIAEANEQVRRIEQSAAARIRRAHEICADTVRRATLEARDESAASAEDSLDGRERMALDRATDRLAAQLCGDGDERRPGF